MLSSRVARAARTLVASPGAWLAAAVVVGVLAPLAPVWLRGLTLIDRDTAEIYAPTRGLVGEALRSGRLPLWNPFVATGMPLLAETVHGVLHPVSVACAFLFPGDGLDPLIALHVASAALGAAVLARALGASRAGAAGAAFAYALSGFTLSMSANLVFLAGAGSLPWLVAGLRAAASERSPGAFVAGAAAFAVAALSGDVQAVAFGTVLGLALPLVEGAPWSLAVRATPCALVGALLAGIQLVPSWFHLGLTDRVLATFDAREWSFAPARLVELAIPGFFAQPVAGVEAPVYRALDPGAGYALPFSSSAHLGAAVLLLAAAGAPRTRAGRLLGGAALAFLWLAFGDRLGAQQLLSHVPVVGGFRFAEKYLAPLGLCVALLAGAGVDAVAEGGRVRRRVTGAAAAALALAAAAWASLASSASAGWLAAAGVPAAEAVRSNLVAGLPHAVVALGALAALAFAVPRMGAARSRAALAALVWVGAAAAVPYALRPGPAEARSGVPAPSLVPAPPVLRVQNVPNALVDPPDEGVEGGPGWSEVDRAAFALAAVAAPDLNVAQRIDNLEVGTGLQPLRYLAAREAFAGDWPLAGRRYAATHVIAAAPRSEAERAALAPVVADAIFDGPEPRTGALVFRIPHRAWAGFPERVHGVPGPEAAEERLAALVRERSRDAVVEAGEPLPAAPGVVHRVQRGVEEVRVDAESSADALLVVNDAFWPGWRARLDGVEVPIWPADLLVRAVPWPAGRHELAMSYEPDEVRWGAWTTAAGAALLLAAVAVLARARGGAGGGP